MAKIAAKCALVLCFSAFLCLDFVNCFDFNRNKTNDFIEKFKNDLNSKKGFEIAIKNRKEVNRVKRNGFNDCYQKFMIDREYKQCIKDVNESWKKVNDSEKVKCCIFYDQSDCRISSAKRICTPTGFEEIHKTLKGEITDQEKDCPNYGYKSFNCSSDLVHSSNYVFGHSLGYHNSCHSVFRYQKDKIVITQNCCLIFFTVFCVLYFYLTQNHIYLCHYILFI
jgi:hypothetical protein